MVSFRWQRKEDPATKAWLLFLSRENNSGGKWSFPEVVSSLGSSCDLMAGSAKGSLPISGPALLSSREEVLYPLLFQMVQQ